MSAPTRELITEPGIYDLTDEQYHADPVAGGSLSSTGARLLLSPSCPAKFDHQRRHPRPSTKAFDFGHAAHRTVLGAGADLVVLDEDDWRTKAARQARDEAHAAGLTPLLKHEYRKVLDMSGALLAHPFAAKLFQPDTGWAEQTLVWRDRPTGVMCRAKLDFLPHHGRTPYLVPDYKSALSVEPEHLRRAVHTFGYYVQAPWYLAGIRALGLSDRPAFLFVAQEKEPPYLVTVFQLTDAAMAAGERRCDEALAVYARCTATGQWPGYATDIEQIDLPAWAIREDLP